MKKIVLILAGLCLAALPLVRLQLVGKQPPAVVPDSSAAMPDMLLEKKVRVVDAAGKPIASATVVPWAIRTTRGAHGMWTAKEFGASEPPTLETDADGEVTIRFPRFAEEAEQIPPKDLTCRVDHPEYAATLYNDVPVTDAERDSVATIVLQRGAQVEVAARADGRLLPMDHVYALWSSPHDGQKTVKVNVAGRLQLPRLPAGMELLRLAYFPVEGPAMFSEVEQLQLVDDEQYDLRVEMRPAVSVQGRLDSDVPRPVKNGRVVAEVIQRPIRGHALEWRACATIKEDGSFNLDALPRGDLQVIALCDGFMAKSGAPPDFASEQERTFTSSHIRPQVFSVAEEENEITLKMTPTADCLIHVLGPDDRPVGSAKCGFWPNVGWWGGGSQVYCHPLYSTFEGLTDPQRVKDRFANDRLFTADTDADGKAVVKNLPPGASSFGVRHSDLELAMDDNQQRYGHVDLTVGEQNEVTVKLQPKGTQFIGEQDLKRKP